MNSVIAISIGAIVGAILRWKFGEMLNHHFPTIPLGTLCANLVGCFLMGGFVFTIWEHSLFSDEIRLGVITGFLGALTTFSTFTAEAFVLFSRGEIFWMAIFYLLHIGGSMLFFAMGYAGTKLFFSVE